MEWLIDTNLILRFSDKTSALHRTACDTLETLFQRGELLHLTGQNMIEFWAVATRSIDANGLGWNCTETDSWIDELINRFLFLEDSSAVFGEWRSLVRIQGVSGKKVHDARLVAVMKVHDIKHLLTFNTADFTAFANIHTIHPNEVLAGKV